MKSVAVGIIMRGGLILACQRRRTVSYPLKWEFPGGKIEPGETPREALVRELNEELAIDAVPGEELLTHEWVYRGGIPDPRRDPAFRVTYFLVRSFSGEPVNLCFETIRWVPVEELASMDILEGNRDAIALLLSGVGPDGSPL
jgi:8-oxo-dGTP diphosphatase